MTWCLFCTLFFPINVKQDATLTSSHKILSKQKEFDFVEQYKWKVLMFFQILWFGQKTHLKVAPIISPKDAFH